MVENPSIHFDIFKEAGADAIYIHVETCPNLEGDLQTLRQLGVEAGVTLNPSTPADTLKYVTHALSHVLVMTVNPGFGGQSFVGTMCDKISRLREMIEARGLQTSIEVDGGVNVDTIKCIVDAGADVLVSGSSIFCPFGSFATSEEIAQAVQALRQAVETKKKPVSR